MSRNSHSCTLFLAVCLSTLLCRSDADAAGKSVTWYLDGSKVEQELTIENSSGEILLPPTLQPGSVRAKPVGGARIARIEFEPVKPGKVEESELARLDARRSELMDRIKALAVKEDIFKSTAKSQGSKAPKRTRTNPEPLSSIRQGTDYAISRLEEVYRARRTVERELKELDRKQAAVKKNEKVSGTVAKVRLEGKRGRVLLSWVTTGEGWTPVYDVRISGGFADITLMARLPVVEKGGASLVVQSLLLNSVYPAPIPLGAGGVSKVSSYRLPIVSEKVVPTLQKSVAVTVRNDTGAYLPPGDSSGFYQEEFIGYTRFGGLRPSESADLMFGASGDRVPDVKTP